MGFFLSRQLFAETIKRAQNLGDYNKVFFNFYFTLFHKIELYSLEVKTNNSSE